MATFQRDSQHTAKSFDSIVEPMRPAVSHERRADVGTAVELESVGARSTTNDTALVTTTRSVFEQGAARYYPALRWSGRPRHVGRAITLCADTRAAYIAGGERDMLEAMRGLASYAQPRLNVPFIRMFERGNGMMLIEIPAPFVRHVHLDSNRAILAQSRILLGPKISDVGSAEMSLDDTRTSHVLIVAGATEKAMLFRALAYQLARQNRPSQLSFVVVDPGHTFSASMDTLAHMAFAPARELGSSDRLSLEWAAQLVHKRRRLRSASGAQHAPRVVVFVPDGSQWLHRSLLLGELLTYGADVGVHVILGINPADRDALTQPLTSQFGARLVAQTLDQTESDIATGMTKSNSHWQLGDGDTLLLPDGVRFQCPLVSEDAFWALPHAVQLPSIWHHGK